MIKEIVKKAICYFRGHEQNYSDYELLNEALGSIEARCIDPHDYEEIRRHIERTKGKLNLHCTRCEERLWSLEKTL